MRRIHLIAGLVVLALFAFTGAIMRRHVPPLPELDDGIRLMYRSRHIYLLGAAIANVLLGLYFTPARAAWRRGLQYFGSGLFLLSPVLIAWAFFTEPAHGLTQHLWRSVYGLYAVFLGTLLHVVSVVTTSRSEHQ